MRRGPLLMVTGWLVAAAAATATGVAAVAVIGDSIAGPSGDVLSAADIERQLAAAASATPTATGSGAPTATGTPRPAATGSGNKVEQTPAGTVVARCEGSIAVLVTWSPSNGYSLREQERRRGVEAEVSFQRDGRRVDVKVTCPAGVPVFEVRNR